MSSLTSSCLSPMHSFLSCVSATYSDSVVDNTIGCFLDPHAIQQLFRKIANPFTRKRRIT
ncbi:hypothetical protein PF005_g7796 [Phytophthora fragariae]|uniref:Uncharacterized protein n=2 Tax=Phytophthora TaxID=4783 RepID=A0A6A3LHE3_9STRA|nr:hypothetical protein PF003_g1731 [Phytophthora fragariae]KAE9030508.1 hypothetical protein PR001_g11231 [Phytophthora rubi]KAE8941739.1 hypothetical protein PF009_g8477 [Phytophthora fragariae]KAE9017970.1 hypothetical protein PF011_g6464 [Phytophthora fragariae]KAE9039973.1 hypothetical protein PR002_g5196 [Phytophthora rubi]